MKEWHVELLRDPFDGSELSLKSTKVIGDEVLEGTLQSQHRTFQISNGIPRFVSSQGYSSNFGWQWSKWAKVQYE